MKPASSATAAPSICCAPSCFPPFLENRAMMRSLRIWSAACSTGQEAFSTGMLLLEHFPQLANWNVRIEGTDISNEVVHRCQSGTYHRIEMNRGLPARNIVRFFDHHGEDWTVKPELKKLCNFRQANLCGNQPPFSPPIDRFDVIFLRNVMLYFSQETRKKLLAHIHRLLARRRPVLRLQRTTRRPQHLDTSPRRGHLLLRWDEAVLWP
jgi:chemotaxis protein methyltransferase CheR